MRYPPETQNEIRRFYEIPDGIKLAFLDTETSGLPTGDDYSSCRPVSLSASVHDLNGYESVFNHIIRPDGYEISQGSIDVHGITQEMANQRGRPYVDVFTELCEFLECASVFAYNSDFDRTNILRLAETNHTILSDSIERFRQIKFYCPLETYKNYSFSYKKLDHLHLLMTGREFENAHSSLDDTRALARLLPELVRRCSVPYDISKPIGHVNTTYTVKIWYTYVPSILLQAGSKLWTIFDNITPKEWNNFVQPCEKLDHKYESIVYTRSGTFDVDEVIAEFNTPVADKRDIEARKKYLYRRINGCKGFTLDEKPIVRDYVRRKFMKMYDYNTEPYVRTTETLLNTTLTVVTHDDTLYDFNTINNVNYVIYFNNLNALYQTTENSFVFITNKFTYDIDNYSVSDSDETRVQMFLNCLPNSPTTCTIVTFFNADQSISPKIDVYTKDESKWNTETHPWIRKFSEFHYDKASNNKLNDVYK